ncbi:MAG TPA: 3D-(3,5/4)-trihydroxycyclohexane-1,2-dione acylhydrolase (decyclizing), partial [Acidimicrobiaceae bacterium]|nr:3D-(3,5/4)-trihydroxycyclohexane-1,2-dione acylhydrolase (decyclizing) [Acidimicrobiaceae bacterium]
MTTVRLSVAGAVVRYLAAQRIRADGAAARLDPADPAAHPVPADPAAVVPLFGGVFAVFGHGNVTALGHELHQARDVLPTWRGQNEQGMALAGLGYARANRRRRIMVAASSIGPGASNMVTAAAAALANRMPLLLLAGDTFTGRGPDPVLQQVEHFGDPSTTVNDAFRPVVRYWDRIVAPSQVLHALPNAVATMLDPADCGPAFIGLPQDVQAQAFDYPAEFFEPTVHDIRRPRPDRRELAAAAALLRRARRPLIVAGGGVRWSLAEAELAEFARRHGIAVVETFAGRSCLASSHPCNCGPVGVAGCASANAMAASADVVLAVGTRLGDFATGSWTVFADPEMEVIGLNTARFDAVKHSGVPLVADAREALADLGAALGDYRAPDDWQAKASTETAQYHAYVDKLAAPTSGGDDGRLPTYAQVVGAVNEAADESTYVVTAAGGMPGELLNGWRSDVVHSFDCEFGFSTMGYEISGGWGAKMALPDREVIVMVGDGSYLMMNSDLYSSVLSGHKLIVVVCDNGGFAVIDRLQRAQGGVSFNNMLDDCRRGDDASNEGAAVPRVDFAAHAAALGCESEQVSTIAEFAAALGRARAATRSYVVVVATEPDSWTDEGGAAWQVGVPEATQRPEVAAAAAAMGEVLKTQRL